jgi:hypothetical protein
MKNCFSGSCMNEILGKQLIEWQTYYCYSFMEAFSAKQKRRKIKVIYSQNGVSLANEKLKLGWTSHVLLDKQEDRH